MNNKELSTKPCNPLEVVLVNVVAQVLEMERVAIHDNFYELGGDSIKATEVIAVLQDFFQCDESLLWTFIAKPTVAALADAVIDNSKCPDVNAAAELIISAMSLPG